ncbi:MAG: PaaI family thioesterase [Deltaproteobacteria bacterium]|nr:PaaI family thioesterase [Deltaproteobacteria bacterium]RLB95998.1 MAG: PaaI family thioesterase [Deltaproteobacteria bacterium]
MTEKAIQDSYPDEGAICYGCGPHNPHGLHIRTYWDGEEGICHFKPRPYHTAFPGFVYGGLIASLIDCHSIGTAIAASYEAEGRQPGTEPRITLVTGTLKVRYLHPTPIDTELVLRARVKELYKKKVIVTCSVYAKGRECAQGEVIGVRAPWDLGLA